MYRRILAKLSRLATQFENAVREPPHSPQHSVGPAEPDREPSVVASINRRAAAWDPDAGIEVVDALGNLAGKPLSSLFPNFPHALFASRHSSYAPWLKSEALRPYFDKVHPPYLHGVRKSPTKGATIVDIYRCWSIWLTVTQLAHLKGDFIEVGAFRGGTAALIGHAMVESGSSGHLFVCDTFKGVVNAGAHDNMYHGGEHAETTVDTVADVVREFLPADRFSILEGIFPEETGGAIDGRSFRFAHLDVDVYSGTRESLLRLWPHFAVGGVVIVDDYALYGTEGVTLAVEEFAADHGDAFLIYNFNGQAMLIKQARSEPR